MRRLVLVRHGRTALNARRIVQGPRLDPPLDPVGEDQAARLADRLADDPPAAIAASQLRRALLTAAPTSRLAGVDVAPCPGLVEMDWGSWNGRAKDARLARDLARLLQRWTAGDRRAAAPGGEPAEDVLERALPAVDSALRTAGDRGAALVVAHGRVLKILLSHLLHDDLAHQERFRTSNGGVTSLVEDGGSWRPDRVDCRAHLLTAVETH